MQGNQGKIVLSLLGLIKVKGKFLLRCLVNNIRKIVRKVLASAITLEEFEISKNRQGGAGKSRVRRRVKGISARKEVVCYERNRRVTKCSQSDVMAILGRS